jgi:hypothetical protein
MDSVTTAIGDVLGDAQTLIGGAVVALLAIPATFVAIKIGKRLMNKA